MDDQLRDLETRMDLEDGDAVIDEEHADLATVACVDRAWRIQHGHLVLQREAAARTNLGFGVRRKFEGDSGMDQSGFTWWNG